MRVATYELDGRPTVGVLVSADRIVALADLWPADRVIGAPPTDMIGLIEAWDRVRPALGAAAGRRGATAGESTADLDAGRRWCAPVPRPSKVLGVAVNNGALSTSATVMPAHPMIFCYPPSALTGHLRPVEIRTEYGLTHPEPELGVIIGRRVKRVPVDEALDVVFGYTVVDDITSVGLKSGDTAVFPGSFADVIGGAPARPGQPARGFEYGDLTLTYHARSKGTDTFAPCGPWIVTRDEIADPQALAVSLTLDGELCIEDNTANLVHTVAAAVSHASDYFTLEPGDLLHVGTAAGGKYRMRDIDYQVRQGMRTIAIESVGSLSNPIVTVE